MAKAKSKLPRALGWFSVGLGITELLGAWNLLRFFGISRGDKLVRGYGARELAAGVALLSPAKKRPWLWARVAGDALDLATMGKGLKEPGVRKGRLLAATGAVAGITLLDIYAAARA
ncbi:hypothetical protein JYK02_13715 [Corallococcus macrosporus]|uniref:Uncharacterized protein n=1 Tax=Corallococcus macrosporus TaxID=35 RepID=A0ABS3DA40_9BACT|nr:hypothetical protein [Corallococcus macrosporus]MBN8228564.1 hypothetical protein [Corallococcus macrosporus]